MPRPAGGSCGAPILISHTSDGGTAWQALTTSRLEPPGPCKSTIRFADAQRGFIGASDPAGSPVVTGTIHVYRSTDGGATWAYAGTAPNDTLDVTFVTATRWLQISSPGDAKETTDGGSSCHPFVTTYQQAAPVGPTVVFGDAQVGHATVRGAIQRTIDGGAPWSSIRTPGTF